jgi:hypothetical protein
MGFRGNDDWHDMSDVVVHFTKAERATPASPCPAGHTRPADGRGTRRPSPGDSREGQDRLHADDVDPLQRRAARWREPARGCSEAHRARRLAACLLLQRDPARHARPPGRAAQPVRHWVSQGRAERQARDATLVRRFGQPSGGRHSRDRQGQSQGWRGSRRSVLEVSDTTDADPGQVLALLKEQEAMGQVRRTGTRAATRWHAITDEDRIAARAAELEGAGGRRSRARKS